MFSDLFLEQNLKRQPRQIVVAVALLFLILFLCLLPGLNAVAAPLACRDLFRNTSLLKTFQNSGQNTGQKSLGNSKVVQWLRAPPFDELKFDAALENYRTGGLGSTNQPKTYEERLAFLHYASNVSKRSPYNLELWARKAKPKDLRALTKSLGKFNFKKGFSPEKIEALMWKLDQFSAAEPNEIKTVIHTTVEERDRLTLEQWSTKEIALSAALEGFNKLGFMKTQNLRGQAADLLRAHPNVVATIASGAMMTLETIVMSSPLSRPRYSKLRTTRLEAKLIELIEREGFDAAYPLLKEKYGHLASFDRGAYFARKAFGIAFASYIVIHMFPTIVANLDLPPNLLTPDMNAVQITAAVSTYYAELGTAVVEDRIEQGFDEPKLDRVPMTFDEQLQESQHHAKITASSPSAAAPTAVAVSGEDQMAKELTELNDHLNSLDFTDHSKH